MRAAPHIRQRRDLDLAAFLRPGEALRGHELVDRVVQRAKIRIDLLLEVAWKEAKPLAGLDRRPGEDEPRDLALSERDDAHRDREVALAGAGDPGREDEVAAADRLDVPPLVVRLRDDALPTHRGRDVITQLLGRSDRCVLGLFDEPLECRLTQALIPARERPHRADKLADPGHRRRLAADPQLGAARDDLHPELVLDPVDVRFVLARDEHHLVGIGDQDRDRRGLGHQACARSFKTAPTTRATVPPSARPFSSAMTFCITLPWSFGPTSPSSAMTRTTTGRIASAASCCGR